MRICVASASNDHRLGANEAPPAILSIFLGSELTTVFEQLVKGKTTAKKSAGLLGLGTPVLPNIPLHSGDRNRTSPFAFTGNKFEFRAVGSDQSISFPVTVLNTIAAESIDALRKDIEAKMKKRKSFENALKEVLKETYKKHERIIFNGDGYADDWQKEAKKRKLLNLRTSVDAYERLMDAKNVKLFSSYEVLNERELEARQEIYYDMYFKKINIEGETMEWLAQAHILPGVLESLEQANGLSSTGSKGVARRVEKLTTLFDDLYDNIEALREQNKELGGDNVHSKSLHMRDNVLPAMEAVRKSADRLERISSYDAWPLPGYREMLFIK